MKDLDQLLASKSSTTEEALTIFDSLETADLAFMLGQWRGFEVKTGHQMDGLLSATRWYGKLFISEERVYPLLFHSFNKSRIYSVDPKLIPLNIKIPKTKLLFPILNILRLILQTKKSSARMRMINYRGRTTGTMVYDKKAIMDHFVKIDNNRMLGIMDQKGSANPYVFILERDNTDYKFNFKR